MWVIKRYLNVMLNLFQHLCQKKEILNQVLPKESLCGE